MKKVFAIVTALTCVFSVCTLFSSCNRSKDADVHVFYYTYSDTYISTVRAALDELADSMRADITGTAGNEYFHSMEYRNGLG